MNKTARVLTLGIAVLTGGGCMTARDHERHVGLESQKEWTLGTVQKEIRPGMTQGDVAAALGSPNIVSRAAEGGETWIYDKAGSEVAYSNSGIAGGLLIVAGHSESGAARTMQKTVTAVIKFNPKGEVVSTAYHASKF
jgi:hypothetical protein